MDKVYKSSAYTEFKSNLLNSKSIAIKCIFLDDKSFKWEKLRLKESDLEFEVKDSTDFFDKTGLIPLFFHKEWRTFICYSKKLDELEVFALHTSVHSYKSYKELLADISQ